MSSYVFNDFKKTSMMGEHNLSAADNTYYVALVNTSAFDGTQMSATSWNSVSADWEISQDTSYNSAGYIAGGKGLSGCTVSIDSTANEAYWDADDLVWSSSTIDANGCVIYKTDGALVCAIDFSKKESSSSANFLITWNVQGIINLG